MSDAQIAELHRNLADLDVASARQKKHAAHIKQAARKMLESVVKRLSDIHPMTEGDEYQRLLQEKGVLEQTLAGDSPPGN